MKRLSLTFNILFVIVIIVLVSILIGKNNIIDEVESKYSGYQEEKKSEINMQRKINNELTQDYNLLVKTNQELKIKNEELIKKIECLTILDGASMSGLKDQGINDYNVITEDLYIHPELIPFDGVLGGTMQFTNIYLLNDNWVYARFEDGHIQGYGLYEFGIDEDLSISWKVIKAILDSAE